MTKNNESPETKDQTRLIKYGLARCIEYTPLVFVDTLEGAELYKGEDAFTKRLKIFRYEITEV